MAYEETTSHASVAKKSKPVYRLSLVIDREGQDPEWVEVAAFWPTKSGRAFTGRTRNLQVIPEGARLVVTTATNGRTK